MISYFPISIQALNYNENIFKKIFVNYLSYRGTNEIKVINLSDIDVNSLCSDGMIKSNFKTINAYYLIINLDLSLNL